MWLTLVFKNLKTFLRTKSGLFVFMVLSMVVCMVASLTIAGMVDATTPVPQDVRGFSTKSFYLSFTQYASYDQDESVEYVQIFDLKEKKFLYIGEDNEKAEKIRREAKNPLSESGYTDIPLASERLFYGDIKGKLRSVWKAHSEELELVSVIGSVDDEGLVGYLAEGPIAQGTTDKWTKQYKPYVYGEGNKMQVVRNQYYESPYQTLAVGDTITLGSTEYTVSSIKEKPMEPPDISTILEINVNAVDDAFIVQDVAFTLKKEVDQAGIARVSEAIKTAFGDMNPKIDVPEAPPLMEKQFNNMVYVLALIIILVVLLNVSRLYAYIMSTRRKALAVFSLCGAGKLKLFAVYMAEIVLMLLGSFLLGWAVFHFGLINLIALLYPSFAEFFTPDIYLKIFGIYIGAGIIIMALNLIPVVRRSIIQLTKEGA